MKYTGYTKKELIDFLQCSEHNYNVERERADNQFLMLVNMQKKLDIAVKALETVVNACDMRLPKKSGISYVRPEHMFIDSIRNKAQEAIAKIKEIK